MNKLRLYRGYVPQIRQIRLKTLIYANKRPPTLLIKGGQWIMIKNRLEDGLND